MRTFRDCYKKLAFAFLVMFSYVTIFPKIMGTREVSPAPSAPVQLAPSMPAKPMVLPIQQPVFMQQPLTQSHTTFTQTEAYFQVPKLRTLVTETFHSDFEPVKHMDIVSSVMVKEAELRDTHWAFYHGTTNVWTLWQDAYAELFSHFNPSVDIGDADFIFLRTQGYESKKAKDFVVRALREQGLIDDNGELKAILLSVHLSLFGGSTFSGESTWKYAMMAKSHAQPKREDYESIMDEFGLPYTYIDELMDLSKLLEMQQQTLLQIFVPKNIVDDISYLAWTKGIPAHQGTIDAVKNSKLKGKGGKTGAVRTLEMLKHKFKKEQEKNPLFKEMLEVAEKGGFSVDAYLNRYCNDPMSLSDLDEVQARLIFTDDFLLNPSSGVKMFRYTGLGHEQMKEYKKRLNAIIKQIFAEKR